MTLSYSKKLSALLRGITPKRIHYLNYLHSFRTKPKLELHKKVCENKDFCNSVITFGDTKILEFYQFAKTDKAPFVIFADLECLIEKIDGCKNVPENSCTTKNNNHLKNHLNA